MMCLLINMRIYTVVGCMPDKIFIIISILLIGVSSMIGAIIGYRRHMERYHRRHREWMKQNKEN